MERRKQKLREKPERIRLGLLIKVAYQQKAISVCEIAQQAGVNIETLRKSLNYPEGTTLETLGKILTALQHSTAPDALRRG